MMEWDGRSKSLNATDGDMHQRQKVYCHSESNSTRSVELCSALGTCALPDLFVLLLDPRFNFDESLIDLAFGIRSRFRGGGTDDGVRKLDEMGRVFSRVTASLKCLIFCKFPEKKYSADVRKLFSTLLVLSDIQGPVDASMALAFLRGEDGGNGIGDAMSDFLGEACPFRRCISNLPLPFTTAAPP